MLILVLGLHCPAFSGDAFLFSIVLPSIVNLRRNQRENSPGTSLLPLWFRFQAPARPSNPFSEDSSMRSMHSSFFVKVSEYKL